MTAKRDESRDVAVLWDWDTLDDGMSTESFPAEVECFDGNELGTGAVRYVIHSQYAELEAENASLSKSFTSVSEMLDKQTENMLALREFVEDIASMQLDHLEDLDGSVLCRARDLIAKVTR